MESLELYQLLHHKYRSEMIGGEGGGGGGLMNNGTFSNCFVQMLSNN